MPDVDVADDIKTKESLENTKPWFNGPKTFSSVKVNPAPLRDTSVLKVNVADGIGVDSGLR